jgi:hypothetical protein
MTDQTALLRDAENYLNALHGSVARHDNLAANFGCAGCELRDRIAAELRAASSAGRAPAALRDRIAEAVRRLHDTGAVYALDAGEPERIADAVLAVLPAPTDQTAETPLSPDYEHPECGFHWHGRDGMDIPMRDGQPVCPRCELRSVEKRLAHRERRCEELRAESKRRGKKVLAQSEEIRALKREIDGVQRQLGAEILRANQAEAELRRLAGEAQQDRCAECGHPHTVHQDGDDPVTPGTCTACETDDAHHDYEPAHKTQSGQPRRGDQFEQWLKTQRDENRDTGHGVWSTLDGLLDRYRLHADTGTPLGEHVCEGQAVGDCQCLEVQQ